MSLSPKARTEDIVVQKTDNETLVYDLKTNKAICLNETAAIVWDNCNGERDISQISAEASKKLKSTVSEEVVLLAIDQLKQEKLLNKVDKLDVEFTGVNRREIIKRIGLTSMVALPIVSSIIAPKASLAQSGCTAACLAPGDVCAGCIGTTINITCFSSTNMTCTGGITQTPISFLCGGIVPSSNDCDRTL